ncbi:hypothetical protein HNR02_005941 [Amycolatopsis endophytica]|uniref:Uncharacterized protein n=1 Tax=Amycolatopsis endophytica TaxID=860233 RepID=A0A853BDP1_9PSEU|nr:hypothetical protein [Amycolatopsis endophytica]NYI92566.1 hypothetical protein [Amycolatopsis endophytica]
MRDHPARERRQLDPGPGARAVHSQHLHEHGLPQHDRLGSRVRAHRDLRAARAAAPAIPAGTSSSRSTASSGRGT